MKTFIVALIVATCLIVPSWANWGGGSYGPVVPVGNLAPAEYVWYKAPGGYALWYGNIQIGAYLVKDCAYFRLLPGPVWERGESPAQLPPGVCRCPSGCKCPPDNCPCGPDNCPCQKKKDEKLTDVLPSGGVETDKIRPNKHILNGKEVSRKEMFDAIQKAEVPKDQDKLRLVVIGSEDATKAILSDLAGIPESKDFLITSYTPDHWAVKDSGLTAGQPFSITALTPDGLVLHRQSDYVGGINSLAEALRDARDDFQADKAPDRRKSDPLLALIEKLKTVSTETWILLAVGGFLLLNLYRKGV